MRKGRGKEARLSFAANLTMGNRNAACVCSRFTPAAGAPEAHVAVRSAVPAQPDVSVGPVGF